MFELSEFAVGSVGLANPALTGDSANAIDRGGGGGQKVLPQVISETKHSSETGRCWKAPVGARLINAKPAP